MKRVGLTIAALLLLAIPSSLLITGLASPARADDVILDAELTRAPDHRHDEAAGKHLMIESLCEAHNNMVLDGMDANGEWIEWTPDQVDLFGSMRAGVGIQSAGSLEFVRTYVVQVWENEIEIFADTLVTVPGRGAAP